MAPKKRYTRVTVYITPEQDDFMKGLSIENDVTYADELRGVLDRGIKEIKRIRLSKTMEVN